MESTCCITSTLIGTGTFQLVENEILVTFFFLLPLASLFNHHCCISSGLERTKGEIERTQQFSKEVVDLLRHQPYFRMPFNKFIPSYHHHFGRQCKLAYYGFTKLLELFEAIPDVLQVCCRYCGRKSGYRSSMVLPSHLS